MHVRGKRGRPHHPIGGDAVGRGVESEEEKTNYISNHAMILLQLSIESGFNRRTDPFCKAVVGS